jgi:hypothetical protein
MRLPLPGCRPLVAGFLLAAVAAVAVPALADKPSGNDYGTAEATPGGTWILYVRTYGSGRSEAYEVFAVRPDGTGAHELWSEPFGGLPALTPDGLAVHEPYPGSTQETELVDPASGVVVRGLPWREPLFSPDGRWVAYVDEFTKALYVVPADASAAPAALATVAVTSDLRPLAWSPDSSRLAFETWGPSPGETLNVIGRDGGGQRQIFVTATSFQAFRVSWLPDGTRFFFSPITDHVYVVGGDGSGLRLFRAGSTSNPRVSPDGRWLLLDRTVERRGRPVYQVLLVRTDGSRERVLRGPRGLISVSVSWLGNSELLGSALGPCPLYGIYILTRSGGVVRRLTNRCPP